MTPDKRAEILWRECFARYDGPHKLGFSQEYFRRVVAAAITAAEKAVWEEATKIIAGECP